MMYEKCAEGAVAIFVCKFGALPPVLEARGVLEKVELLPKERR
jgi:hypothetical protein